MRSVRSDLTQFGFGGESGSGGVITRIEALEENVELLEDDVDKAFSQMNYSTQEHVVGEWIDGKPIYSITKVFDTPTTGSNEHNIAHGIENISQCLDFKYGFIDENSGSMQKNRIQPIEMINNSPVNALIGVSIYSFNRNNIKLMIGNSFASGNARLPKYHVTFYYTKTE